VNQVIEAFKILTADEKVKGIGIMKCDVIASGIVNAAKQVSKAMFCYTKTKQIRLQDSVSLCS
jgi:succinyl-CoA synthetase beta subunit